MGIRSTVVQVSLLYGAGMCQPTIPALYLAATGTINSTLPLHRHYYSGKRQLPNRHDTGMTAVLRMNISRRYQSLDLRMCRSVSFVLKGGWTMNGMRRGRSGSGGIFFRVFRIAVFALLCTYVGLFAPCSSAFVDSRIFFRYAFHKFELLFYIRLFYVFYVL